MNIKLVILIVTFCLSSAHAHAMQDRVQANRAYLDQAGRARLAFQIAMVAALTTSFWLQPMVESFLRPVYEHCKNVPEADRNECAQNAHNRHTLLHRLVAIPAAIAGIWAGYESLKAVHRLFPGR